MLTGETPFCHHLPLYSWDSGWDPGAQYLGTTQEELAEEAPLGQAERGPPYVDTRPLWHRPACGLEVPTPGGCSPALGIFRAWGHVFPALPPGNLGCHACTPQQRPQPVRGWMGWMDG